MKKQRLQKKSSMKKKKNQLPYLPNELIIQILLRLPVKSLIGFKCVCKSWLTLISDSHFANSQFQLTTATHTNKAFFISPVSPHQARSIDLEASLDDQTASVSLKRMKFIPSRPYPRIEIIGSCRGFILLLRRSTFYLWNPSTGIHKNIPLSPLSLNLDADAEKFYGFGYDQSTDDYLIVLMSSGTNSSYLEFFSLRANTWKQIDEGTHIHCSHVAEDSYKAGLPFNGAIHWFVYRHDLEKYVIVAFDLKDRKFLDMRLPYQIDLEIDDYSGLWVVREFLSLWVTNYNNGTVEIWVMKEYRVHSSWTMTHVLPIDASYFFPLCCAKSGDIVGTNGHSTLVKYNYEGQLLGHRSYFNHPHGSLVVMYTESLLSLPIDNVQA